MGVTPGILFVDAYEPKDSETKCREGQILVFRINSNNYVCVFEATADRWVSLGIAEIVDLAEEKSTEEIMERETVEDSIQEQNSDVKIEWLTWSFFRITTPGGKVILTNPWYTNPDSSISLDDIPEADIILVPAGHPDEVGNALEVAAKTNATIVASHELINLVWKDENAGFGAPITFDNITIQTESFQPGTTTTIDGITIRAVTAPR